MTSGSNIPNKSGSAPTSSTRKFVTYALRFGIPLVISVGLCYLLFAKQDFGEMVRIVRSDCNYWWIVLALGISVFSHVFRAMRWNIQLRALNIRAGLWTLTLSVFGTYAVNLVFPRLGEIWRSGYVAQKEDASFTTVFGSMIAERVADLVTVIILTCCTLAFAGRQMVNYLRQNEDMYMKVMELLASPWLWSIVVALIAAIVLVFVYLPHNAVVVKIKELCAGVWKGFAVIATMPGKGKWLFYTVCIWGCYFLQLYVAFFAFPATAEVVALYGIPAVMVCFVLSSISMGVPSNGGIGPWQWAIMFGLSMYTAGIPQLTQSYAASFANLVMGSQTLLLIALGLLTFASIAVQRRRAK